MQFSGRLGLQLASQPPQSFASQFDLNGNQTQGQLLLTTPLGSTLAQLQWSPAGAQMTANNETRDFASVQAMLESLTGAAPPIEGLLAWLRGQNAEISGWTVDLSRYSEGRIIATRTAPLPTAVLRIILVP